MKQKIQFEPSDFESGGQIIVRQSSSIDSSDLSFKSSVAYKIGWKSNVGANTIMKIALSDGMCIEYSTVDSLCFDLNNDPYGYRPMDKKEIVDVMNYLGNRFAE